MTYRLTIEIAAQIGSRIVCSLLGLVLVTQLCRYLSIDDFGVYTLSFSVLAFFSPIVEIGMTTIAIREITRAPEQEEEILCSVIIVKLILAIMSFIAAAIFATWIGRDTHQKTVIILASFGLFNLVLNSIDVWLVVHQRMVMWGLAQILASLMGLITILILIWSDQSLHAIILAQIGTIALAYIWIYICLRDEFRFCLPKLQVTLFIIRESFPHGIASLFAIYYLTIDMFMLAKLLNAEAVALYGSAYRLLNLMAFAPHAIMMSFTPMLTRALQQGANRFAWLFHYTFQLMLYIAIPTAVWASWYADKIISWIYTDTYSAAAPVLIILVWAGVGMFATHLCMYALIILNRQKAGIYVYAAALGLNIAMNLLMIRIWGVSGAALATLFTEAFVIICGFSLCYYYARVLPFSALLLRCAMLTLAVFLLLVLAGKNAIICTILIWGIIGFSFFYFLQGKDESRLHEYLKSK